MKKSIAISIILASIIFWSLAYVYAFDGQVITPTENQEYTYNETQTVIEVTFETVPWQSYAAYVCDSSVNPDGLSWAALEAFMIDNDCTEVFVWEAWDTVSVGYFMIEDETTFELLPIPIGDYRLHVVEYTCALAMEF